MKNKSGLWYPVQMLSPKKKSVEGNKNNKQGLWHPIQTLGPKK